MGWRLPVRFAPSPICERAALVVLEGPCVPQPAYRIYCDLRSYDDDQVRRVYEWFIREAERSERAAATIRV